MGKREQNQKKAGLNNRLLLIICGVLLAVVIVLAALLGIALGDRSGSGDAGENSSSASSQESSMPPLAVSSTMEEGDLIRLVTTYCEVCYPYAFSDVIGVEAVMMGEHAALEFTAAIYGQAVPIYTFWFNGEGSVRLGELTLSDGSQVSVSVDLHQIPEGLTGDNATTFHAAQETFNDVMVSLAENENFISDF